MEEEDEVEDLENEDLLDRDLDDLLRDQEEEDSGSFVIGNSDEDAEYRPPPASYHSPILSTEDDLLSSTKMSTRSSSPKEKTLGPTDASGSARGSITNGN